MDRRIRRYVAAKQKLIALLEEEKQAVVNQAVTAGPGSQRPPQALWRRVAGRCAGALGGAAAAAMSRLCRDRYDSQYGSASLDGVVIEFRGLLASRT